MKKKTRNLIIAVVLVAAAVLLLGMFIKVNGFGKKQVVNPDNLVSIEAIGKGNYAQQRGNTGYGITVNVNDNGAITMTGKATADLVYYVCDVDLTAGKTYTLSAGVSGQSRVTGANASETGYAVVLKDLTSNNYVYAELDGTFEVPSGSSTYELEIIVKKDTNLGITGKTFKPVVVEGAKVGAFLTAAE